MRRIRLCCCVPVALLILSVTAILPVWAQSNFDNVQIETTQVAEGVYMLVGSGGNMGLSVGEDGTFLIDDQYAPLTEKIKEAIESVTAHPVKFVLNTHWHGDHTGGNENFGEMGALIVAHENVRKRMSVEQFMEAFGRKVPPSPPTALPVVTFNDTVTFHLNGVEIRAFHVAPAHTDGDTVIHFKNKNVIHMGDVFFNGIYPFIDVSAGGSIEGMIEAVEQVLKIAQDNTTIIPGHGPLAKRADLQAYHRMLVGVRDQVKPLVQAGKSVEAVVQATPTSEFDEKWGKGFMNPETFVKIVYDSLTKNAL